MPPDIHIPTERASFNQAISAIREEHAVLRHLAENVTERSVFSTDDTLSLAEAVKNHERNEAALFALPFLSRPPEIVTATAARSQRRCEEFISGSSTLPNSSTAAALFVEALLSHIVAEEAWLAREDRYQKERLKILS
jgi:hypothetical protein